MSILRSRLFPFALVLAVLVLSGSVARAAEPELAKSIESGTYEVTGVTVNESTGEQRPIHGHLVLRVTGDRYTSRSDLQTLYPGSPAVAAKVVGTGEGTVRGGELTGTAESRLSVSAVKGVDVGFAFVPREVSPKILSRATAKFFSDGSIRVEITNEPAPGEDYEPTKTTLVGYRDKGDKAK